MDVQAHGLFIGGRTVPSASESMTEILDPATNHALARVAAGTKDDVNAAVEAARNAFDSPEWRGPDASKHWTRPLLLSPPKWGRIDMAPRLLSPAIRNAP